MYTYTCTQKLHTTEMRMLNNCAREMSNKSHTKNEDIWREAHIEPMTTFFSKTIAMAWERVKEGRRGYHHEYTMYILQVQGNRRKGGSRKDGNITPYKA